MAVRLTLLCHAATAATRTASFPDDEPLDDAALAALRAWPQARPTQAWCSPAQAAVATAATLGLAALPVQDLRDCDYGRWSGRRITDVFAQEPAAIEAWRTDPDAAPHGGETLRAVLARVAVWLETLVPTRGNIVAVTHAAVLRAAAVHALGAPPAAFWRIDAPPGACLRLSGADGRWNLALDANHGRNDTV